MGANDGASGVAVVLELARALASDAPLDGPSVHLALFDAEEARGTRPFDVDGTRGQPPVRALRGGRRGAGLAARSTRSRRWCCSTWSGDCDLQIPLEPNSDPALYEQFAEATTESTGEPGPFTGTTTPIGDDHIPFLEAGIPAVDLIDFTYRRRDRAQARTGTRPPTHSTRSAPESLDAVGEAALAALPAVGR